MSVQDQEEIDDARFEGQLDAHLFYLWSLGPERAAVRIRRLYERGAWREDPHVFLNRLPLEGAGFSLDVVGRIWVEVLASLSWEDAKRTLFRNAFVLWARCSAEVMNEALTWVASKAGPGDADLLVDGFGTIALNERAHDADVLIDWVLAHGVSALRNPSNAGALVAMWRQLVTVGRLEDASLLLTLIAYVDRALEDLKGRPSAGEFWGAVEACQPGPALVANLVTRAIQISGDAFWPLKNPEQVPALAKEILGILGRGELPADYAKVAWRAALSKPPHCQVDTSVFRDVGTVLLGLSLLNDFDVRTWHPVSWTDLLTRALWALRAAPSSETLDLRHEALFRLAGWTETAPGVQSALLHQLQGMTGAQVDLARELLTEPANTLRVRAALSLFVPTVVEVEDASVEPEALEALRVRIESIVLRPQFERAHGVDINALTRGCLRLTFKALPNDDKVRVQGSELEVDEGYPVTLLRKGLRSEALLQLVALYVMHELIHVTQGIRELPRVRRLRAAGAETTLLHMDLAADHAAALAVHGAMPSWSVADLKDRITRSLAFFPSSGFHTAASRVRKSLRVVSSRLDALVHLRGVDQRGAGGGYWFIDFGPLGGDAFALVSGPPVGLVADIKLTAEEARMLLSASEGETAQAAVEPILVRFVNAIDASLKE